MDRPEAAILLQFLVRLSVWYCWYTRNFECVCTVVSSYFVWWLGVFVAFLSNPFSLFWTLNLFCLSREQARAIKIL